MYFVLNISAPENITKTWKCTFLTLLKSCSNKMFGYVKDYPPSPGSAVP